MSENRLSWINHIRGNRWNCTSEKKQKNENPTNVKGGGGGNVNRVCSGSSKQAKSIGGGRSAKLELDIPEKEGKLVRATRRKTKS